MNKYIFEKIMNILSDDRGVAALEYAIVAAGIVVAVTAAVSGFGPGLLAKFTALGA